MSEVMTVRGFVATDPRLKKLENGTDATDFRLACSQRWFDREKNEWVDGQTNWFSVTAYRELARNSVSSIKKGEKVIVVGRLKVRTFTREDSTVGTYVGLEAQSIGHDLTWASSAVIHKSYPPKSSNDTTQASSPESAGAAEEGNSITPEEELCADADQQFEAEDTDDRELAMR